MISFTDTGRNLTRKAWIGIKSSQHKTAPEKGDLTLPKHWRSIAPRDVLSTILSSIITTRLLVSKYGHRVSISQATIVSTRP